MYKYIALSIISISILSVYFKTLSPSIAGGDSGELVAEGCVLGLAHPPGYPLFTMLIYLLKKYVSFGSPAMRVNAMSAVFTSLAAYLIGLIVTSAQLSIDNDDKKDSKEEDNKVTYLGGSLFSMGMFSFSPLIWQYAVTAEVFPMNTFFAALICYLVIVFAIKRDVKIAYLGAFICGLAICNQHTIMLYEVPLILWMLFLLRRKIFSNFLILFYLSMCFIAGLIPYMYLPLAIKYNHQKGSWGYPLTIEGFLNHFLRKDYGTFQLYSGNSGKQVEGFLQRTTAYIKDLHYEQGLYVTSILALIGVLSWWTIPCLQKQQQKQINKKNSKIKEQAVITKGPQISPVEASYTPIALLCTQFFYFAVFHTLSNLPLNEKLLYGVHQRFWMQPAILTFSLAGIGFDQLTAFIAKIFQVKLESKHQNLNGVINKGIISTQALIAIVIVLLQLNKWYWISDQSEAYNFHHYAHALLDPLPENAIILINYDQQWTSTRYVQKCEGHREDVTAINLSMMTYKWFGTQVGLFDDVAFPGKYFSPRGKTVDGGFTLSEFIDLNYFDRPIFISGKMQSPDSHFLQHFELVPLGLSSRIYRKSDIPHPSDYMYMNENSWSKVATTLHTLPDLKKYPPETWEWTIGRDVTDRVSDCASFFLEQAIPKSSEDPIPLINAQYWLESAMILEEDRFGKVPTTMLKNTGLGYVHFVQNKLIPDPFPKPLTDTFITIQSGRLYWPKEDPKSWASVRFSQTWGEFLTRPDAKDDSQYPTMKNMYYQATGGKNIYLQEKGIISDTKIDESAVKSKKKKTKRS